MIRFESIPLGEAARYMGVRGESDERTTELLKKAEELVLNKIRPKYVYREFALERSEGGISLLGTDIVMTGKDIASHLNGCDRAVLLAVTLSAEADRLIRATSVTDMALSLAVDSVCSAAVEKVCDEAEKEIFSAAEAPYRTWRYSPGYGDLPLEIQGSVLEALNAQRRIGLTATESCLLVPTKSVTAIIGISKTPVEFGKHGCAVCNIRQNCAFSRLGGVCGK